MRGDIAVRRKMSSVRTFAGQGGDLHQGYAVMYMYK